MRKMMLFGLPLVLIFGFFLGCQSNNELTAGNISKITISKLSGPVQKENFVFEDEVTLKTFKDVIAKAAKIEGIVNTTDPEYDLEVLYTNETKQHYYLWVGENGEKSALMKADDTHTLYSIEEEITNQLVDLIK